MRPSLPVARRTPRRHRGFTLIELMITVAVVALLARIAIPAYMAYVTRGKLAEAFSTLTAYTTQMGQFYQDNRTYVGACSTLPTSTNFTYTCPTLTSTSYLLSASGSTNATTGFTFTLTDAGVRATTAAPSGWSTSTSCWINSKSGSCQ